MDINDKNLLKEIIEFCGHNYEKEIKDNFENVKNIDCREYPLDKEIKQILEELSDYLKTTEVDEIPYDKNEKMDKLWIKLVEKSIKCLRFFDIREPFQENTTKHPLVYGIDELEGYHKKYEEFEGLLYGGDCYYRDHMFHVIRCWMLGIYCLLTSNSKITINHTKLIEEMHIEGEVYNINEVSNVLDQYEEKNIEKVINNKTKLKDKNKKSRIMSEKRILIMTEGFSDNINVLEKISMWTIIALCHDLGYPLEKSQKIINKTKEMMGAFVSNPKIWSDISFNGIQNNINDYIIKFMSSKMKYNEQQSKYNGRIQPKYYLKYTKSLEKYSHGIISSIIIYKILLYFIEADMNLNDDYLFEEEDARQFYIRREILRAMSSHTCEDIYQMEVTTFTALLFLCDEFQEWGRKSWKSLYKGLNPNAIKTKLNKFNSCSIDLEDEVDMKNSTLNQIEDNVERIIKRQYILYKTTFRDGQYTAKRNFDINKKITIEINKDKFRSIENLIIKYSINHKNNDSFMISIVSSGNKSASYDDQNLVRSIKKVIEDFKNKYLNDNISIDVDEDKHTYNK